MSAPSRAQTLILLVLATAAVLAGCLNAPTETTQPVSPSLQQKQKLLDVLADIPVPTYDRAAGVDWWENFVNTYSYRHWGGPQNLLAAQYLEDELTAAGFDAETLTYKGAPRVPTGGAVPGGAQADFLVVHGLHKGKTNPDHRLVLVAHYDTVPNTAQGAYDDGAGTGTEMQICKLLVKVETNKTIECVFFDGEEQGLVASNAYVSDYAKGGKDWIWDQGFGYDMTGLNWPGFKQFKLWVMVGTNTDQLVEYTEAHQTFMNITMYEFLDDRLGVTVDGVETLPLADRNSDEGNFKRLADVPVIRFAGGRKAADYPQYHGPADTVPYVYQYACGCTDLATGKETFAKGFEMIVLTSYYTILAWDQFDPKQIDL